MSPALSYTTAVHPIVRLENPIRRYAWGSRTFLARLQGRPFPTPEPEAELWIGAHPAAPSRVVTETGPVPLPEWIARDPDGILGPEVAARFGGELPFLVKILAVEQPLSVQVHPDAEQARAGFERENAAGIPLDAPHRCYRDPRPKPELVCALTPFEALGGLRPAREVAAELAALEIRALRPLLEALEGPGDEGEALRRAFATLLAWPAGERQGLVAGVAEAAGRRGAGAASPPHAWAARLAAAWPGDPLVLAPFFLHHVRLAPGERLFVPPGTLHAYLAGAAVEVQASSDNVLRAGLTTKHVDVEEVGRVARLEALPPRVPEAEASFPFQLETLCAGPDRLARRGGTLQILLCVEGRVDVTEGDGRASSHLPLRPGAACLVPGSAGTHQLTGAGRVVSTTVQAPL